MNKLKKIWLAFTHEEVKALPLACLGATVGLGAMTVWFSSWVFFGLTLFALALLVWGVSESIKVLDIAEKKGWETLGHSWVRDGDTEEEVRDRFAQFNSNGSAGFPLSSKPVVNVDGTPMVGDIDIHGRVFGDVHAVGFNSVSDVGNNTFMDPSSSYSSPFGRD